MNEQVQAALQNQKRGGDSRGQGVKLGKGIAEVCVELDGSRGFCYRPA
jgi:hypothetical protein